MFARRFFYVSAALFLLALTYHLGARTATAQAPGNAVIQFGPSGDVITANGDVYWIGLGKTFPLQPVYKGNLFGAPPPPSSAKLNKIKD